MFGQSAPLCAGHQQPGVCVEGVWRCAVLPVRSRCWAVLPPGRPAPTRLLVTVELASWTAFTLQVFPLSPIVAGKLTTRGYRRRDDIGFDVFEIPLRDYDLVLGDVIPAAVRGIFAQIDVDHVPQPVLKLARAPHETRHTSSRPPEQAIPKIWDCLLEFQQDSVRFAVERGGRALLADDMGLGKTVQCLALCEYYRDDWPLLIVCPATMRVHWKDMARKWLSASSNIAIPKSKNDIMGMLALPQIVVLSYALVKTVLPLIKSRWENRWTPNDESHHLKESTSQRACELKKWLKCSRRVILLTGTPALNRPAELFSTVDILSTGLLGSKIQFEKRYCQGHKDPRSGRWMNRGSHHETELYLVLTRCLMVRHLKRDVMRCMPKKIRNMVRSVVDTPISIEETVRREMEGGGQQSDNLVNLYFESASHKLVAAASLIRTFLQKDSSPFIVFGHHELVLDGLQAILDQTCTTFVRIDGATSPTDRDNAVRRFIKGDARVALLSFGSCATGLNLASACSSMIFAELPWTPALLFQAEDRIHRIGQQSPSCTYHYVIVRGTSDDFMMPAIERKIRTLAHTLDGAGVDPTPGSTSSAQPELPFRNP
ncbi:hypothetical protein PBRA_007425 [Plasmodiophora brassicae]|uniref:SWI/SNF-related matrix-associated actin-dependent regulator of chromatin subfamily A-like protein 1 n=1 Tax=Plasmodiophora brassicae TaxID=37360 RepID=A0A0G4IWT6_PLABS|nr:hypothetical protein PBRA_007425 [Plasmodiophora brassicae]